MQRCAADEILHLHCKCFALQYLVSVAVRALLLLRRIRTLEVGRHCRHYETLRTTTPSQLGGVRSNTFGHEDTRKLNSNARLNWTVLDFKETANSAHFHYYRRTIWKVVRTAHKFSVTPSASQQVAAQPSRRGGTNSLHLIFGQRWL